MLQLKYKADASNPTTALSTGQLLLLNCDIRQHILNTTNTYHLPTIGTAWNTRDFARWEVTSSFFYVNVSFSVSAHYDKLFAKPYFCRCIKVFTHESHFLQTVSASKTFCSRAPLEHARTSCRSLVQVLSVPCFYVVQGKSRTQSKIFSMKAFITNAPKTASNFSWEKELCLPTEAMYLNCHPAVN